MALELRAGAARAVVLPERGGRLQQVTAPSAAGALDLLTPLDEVDAFRGGCFPMAPWPNRVADARVAFRGTTATLAANDGAHALHGLVYEQPWEVTEATDTSCTLRANAGAPWPWPSTVTQRFTLTPSSLAMTMELRPDAGVAPAGLGWHPWFRRDLGAGGPLHVRVPASDRYVLRGQIPTGATAPNDPDANLAARTLDDCLTGLAGPVVLTWPGALRLELATDCTMPHVHVYTTPDAVCIEPQTCPPDAFALAARGLIPEATVVATPAEPLRIACEWRWAATAP